MAITDPSKGIKGISAFIVERDFPGFGIGKNELKMGMHGCTTAPLAFTDCEVPAENLLGAEGMGYVQAMKTLTAGRVTVSARCCGMMDKLIAQMRRVHENAHAGRQAARRPPGTAVDARGHVGRARRGARPHLARDRCAAARRARHDGSVGGEAVQHRGARRKSSTAAVQIHGGMGYMRELGIETTYRDARIVRIYEGTSEIQRNIIAGQLLKDD